MILEKAIHHDHEEHEVNSMACHAFAKHFCFSEKLFKFLYKLLKDFTTFMSFMVKLPDLG